MDFLFSLLDESKIVDASGASGSKRNAPKYTVVENLGLESSDAMHANTAV